MKLHLEAEEALAASKKSGGDNEGNTVESDSKSPCVQAFSAPRSLGACRLHSLSPSSLKTLLYRTLCSDNLELGQSLQTRRRRDISCSRDRKSILSSILSLY